MTAIQIIIVGGSSILLAGCAGVRFSNTDDQRSLEYHSVVPAVRITQDSECKLASEVVSIPGPPRYLSMKSGLGKGDTTVDFGAGGIITKINSKTEGQVDDALKIASAVMGVAGVRTAGTKDATPPAKTCNPTTATYLIDYVNGRPTVDMSNPFVLKTFPKPGAGGE